MSKPELLVTVTTDEFQKMLRDTVREELRGLPTPEPETWVTVSRAAEIYDCTPQHIRDLIADGAPARRLGVKELRINLQAFGEWLDERTKDRARDGGDKPPKKLRAV